MGQESRLKKLGVGILGCGKMGRVYARYFTLSPHCRMIGFYNRTVQWAQELALQYPGVKVYQTWEALVEDGDVDIVGMCTPSHEHREQLEVALRCGKHVLCEKPMASDVNECRKMLDAVERSRNKVMVGFQMRFHPVVRKVDELLKSIGEVYHVDFDFGMYRPEIGWRHKIEQRGGVLKELASHLFDLAVHWCGPVSSVTGVNRIIQEGREVEDYSVNIMEFKSGATGYLFSNYHDRRGRLIKGNIMGIEGQIVWQFSPYKPEDSRVSLFTDGRRDFPVEIPECVDETYPGHLDSFRREIEHFVDCIVNDRVPVVGCREGLDAMEIIDASYESQRKGEKVRLPLWFFPADNIEMCFNKRWQR
jgi:predicted dehydrogenase